MSSQKDRERELYDSALVDGAKEIPQAIGMPNDPMIIAADVTLAPPCSTRTCACCAPTAPCCRRWDAPRRT